MRTSLLDAVCEPRIEMCDPRRAPETEFSYIDISSVDNVAKCIVSPSRIKGAGAPSRARQRVRTGDVLVATTRPNLNAVALVGAELDGQIASTGFCVLRAKIDRLSPEFLHLWVRHPAFVESLSSLVQGALYPAVSDRQVREQAIPLPPLARQREIVARLDAQLAATTRARTAVAVQLAEAEKLLSAFLAQAFSSVHSASRKRLIELAESPLRTGTSKPALPGSAFRCLTLSAVRHGALDFDASKPVELTSEESAKSQVRGGAFYVVRGNGNKSLVGRGALAPAAPPAHMAFPDLLFEVRPDPAKLRTDFLRWAWDSAAVREQIESASATAAGIYKINQRNLGAITLPVPELAKQEEVAARLNRESAATRALIAQLTARLADLDRLPAALLREAFAG